MLHFDLPVAMLFAYLLGSIASAILVCKLMGLPDPRKKGSKNPGATNVLRIGGRNAALLTLSCDMLKGFLPVFAAKLYGFGSFDLSLIALSAFLGHLYPIFFHFRGGKGVATLLGTLLAISWLLGLILAITWLAAAFFFRYSSLAAMIMSLCAPIYTWYLIDENSAFAIILMSILLLIRHRLNILKLLTGTENKIGGK